MLRPGGRTVLAKVGGRFNPPEYVESVRKQHLSAGIIEPDTIERFLATRILGFLFIPVWVIVMITSNPARLCPAEADGRSSVWAP